MSLFDRVWFFKEVLRPVLDIAILSFLIYQFYLIFAKTRALQLVKGLFIIALIYAFAFFFKLDTLLWIMKSFMTVFVIIIAVVFQPELRNIFRRMGRGGLFKLSPEGQSYQLDSVLNAAEVLSGRRRGALIVFIRNVDMKNIIETGTRLNADLSSSLILTIFSFDTTLHDGALIIQEGKIVAAGCFLPLSEQADIRRSFGTRHRAALGLAEESDAVILVVSEQTGAISLAYDANLYYDLSLDEVKSSLKRLLNFREDPEEKGEEQNFEE